MREADVPAFIDLFEAVAEEGRWIATEAPLDRDAFALRVHAALANEAQASFVALDETEMLVGHLHLYVSENDERSAGFGMVVDRRRRGCGVGGALLDAAIAHARSIGLTRIELGVFPDNDAAIGLYSSRNFVDIGPWAQPLRRANGELREVRRMELAL